jgi:hypothetical protein
MFDQNNESHIKKALEYCTQFAGDFFNSSMYSDQWDRFEKRLKAYRCQHDTNAPKWRSKLHFATFFMGCKALDSQYKRSHRTDPFAWVSAETGSATNPEVAEKAKIAQYDLTHDLYISNFVTTLNEMYWYVELIGGCVGREYVFSDQVESTARRLEIDRFGIEQQTQQTAITRREHTKTELVHPLNFFHTPTKPDFKRSHRAGVRIEVPISEIYKMRDDKEYYQQGVKEVIAQIESSDGKTGWTVGKDTFYCENYDSKSNIVNTLILYEYSGDFSFKGNYDDG